METWIVGARRVDPVRRTCSGPDGSTRLTATEVALLGYLLRAEGRPVPRDELLREVSNAVQCTDESELDLSLG